MGSVTISGAPEGFDATLIARAAADRQVLHVARDDARHRAMRMALGFVAPGLPVFSFPAWDCLPYDRMSPNPEISAARMGLLAMLAGGFDRPFVLLTTISAVAQRIPVRTLVAEASFTATVGRQLDVAGLRNYFARMGFTQAATVTEPGNFAIRGGLIDVYPPGETGPVRLDMFGDVLDNARRFDPVNQRTTENLERLELAPVSEVILDEPSIRRFRRNYRTEFGTTGTDDPLYEAVSVGQKHAGAEHWLPFFHERLETLFDYVPGATLFLDDRVEAAREARWQTIVDQYSARVEALRSKSRIDSIYKPCPPGLLYLDKDAFTAITAGHAKKHLSVLPQSTGAGVIDAGGRIGRNFAPERKSEKVILFSALANHVKAHRTESQVIIASWSDGARERLSGLLADQGVIGLNTIDRLPENPQKGTVCLAVWPLDEGFEAPGLTVISEQDVLGDRLIRAPRRKRRAENFLTETTNLGTGDLVVHIDHGIGCYKGLETVTVAGAPHDCLLLEYAKGDRLYLPVENIELLSRYGHKEGMLDRLGGSAWQARKASLKKRIREMADKLIRVAAERALRKAAVMVPPADTWDTFCARFPYAETDDQLNAIGDVVEDLASGTPMDRLVCGDVGFGKTEVALRAAFLAAHAGVQVAVIAPTTLLARQHYKSFSERFRGTGIRIRHLSRFVSAKEAAVTRNEICDGRVEIVVGTHALLARGVNFARLGLLVIDEEQHFGVAHKERLKELRSDIHVLTLTATPIPRTLQMSLSGVRDLSIIGTPPVDRLAIRTYVSEFDTVTLREALLREHYRGGQSFFVVPRIADQPDIEEFLRSEVPEVTYVVANGKMLPGALDERMNAFYDGKYDVLLATTIVESGLDIPTANTMIVHRADMFGLAQLYQIRGRVGRSKTRAYAYLTTKPGVPLTPNAEKRLRMLGSLDSLGAGFALASQDLDIRGAGNLLGDAQSGHIREVGFELYQEMLEEAITRMKTGGPEDFPDAADGWSPQINLGVPVLIPADYVGDLDVRLGLYRRLSELSTRVELEGFAAELIDRFGNLPDEVETLLRVVRIKAMCYRAGIAQLDGGPKGAVIRFRNDKFSNPAGLVEYFQASNGTARLKDNKVVVRRNWDKDTQKIKGAYIIVRDLARLAA
ncbi:MAG: transcription-repair coupling factor [Rhodobacteraceae bacterium]|nr:transcription-repair coupling factor [Paracoccaceae bacterium]